jgi:flavin reductase (DIM6/NTAB) family NADH-FMN oxidoreductase RutF
MRKQIGTFDAADETFEALKDGSALLVTGEQGNPMVIGWGTLGQIWGRPVFTVLVRPSRYSFMLLERLGEFTVNLIPHGYKKALAICGSRSGRDIDKLEATGLCAEPSQSVGVPYLDQSTLHYECRVVHHTEVLPGTIDQDLNERMYGSGDYHRIYHGEILGVFRTEE